MRSVGRIVAILLACCLLAPADQAWAKRAKSRSAKPAVVQTAPVRSSKSSSKSAAAKSGNPRLRVKAALVTEMESGTVLFERDADKQIAPASLTKILTLYVVQEAIEQGRLSRTDMVRVSPRAACTGGSVMDLRSGELVSVGDLMKGMAVASGNDACVAIAEHMAGDVGSFVRLMNRKARSLGMIRSVFKTPNGLPADGQVTTARDMQKLARAYIKRFPGSLAEIHSTRSFFHNRRNHQNANRLLGDFEGADGLKTGYVNASGYNIIATAKRENKRIVAVLLGAPSSGVRKREAAKLMETAFVQLGKPATALALAKPQTEVSPADEEVEIAQAALHPEAQGGGLHGREPASRAKAAPKGPVQSLEVPAKGRYTIQESSFRSRENAEQRKTALNGEGIPARMVATQGGGREKWYRVLIGRYPSLEAAESIRRRLASEYGLPHVIIMQ